MLRQHHRVQRFAVLLFLLVACGSEQLLAQIQSNLPAFSQIVVFGDSLSDTGNVRVRADAVSGGTMNYPSQLYNYSDGRFTNSNDTNPSSTAFVGVWHEQLAQTFLHITPAINSLDGGTNFAFGAATTESGSQQVLIFQTAQGHLVITIDNIGQQVDDYLATYSIDPNALYLIWGGENDIVEDDSPAGVSAAAARITDLASRLAVAGARYIMILNQIPLGTIPFVSAYSETIQAWNSASANFRKALNIDLTAELNYLTPQGVTPTLYQVDLWRNMIRLLCNPATDGFTNTGTESQGNPTADPDHFVFWDGWHPTTAGHYWTARSAYETVTTPTIPPAKLLNISTRVYVDTGERVSIAGFIITGEFPKRVLIRGLGPSLHRNGVPDPLIDPTLTLLGELQNILLTNDNWRDTQESEIIATGIPPERDSESAIVATLSPGTYTALLQGKNGTAGNGLIEVYDLEPDTNSTLANLSTRGFVGSDDNAMIGGLVIGEGDNPLVVLRAMGPSLAGAITDFLRDPTMELHDGNGVLIGINDDWRDGHFQAVQATELAPSDDHESAIVAFLNPGSYTIVVQGSDGGTGVAVVEAYRLP